MNNRTKKLLSVLIAIVLTLSCFGAAFSAFAVDLVAINATNFPDVGWRQIVSEYYDKDSDGYLSDTERNVTTMSIPGMVYSVLGDDGKVESIKGIEFFTGVKNLRCGGIGLKTLDVSKLTALTSLTCQGNELTSLTVKNNVYLEELNCSDNQLTALALSFNIQLQRLLCEENMITSIDTSALTALSYFKCSNNELTGLDLSKNTAIETLICSGNHIASLDLSANTSLISATTYAIGGQTIAAPAEAIDNNTFKIICPFDDSSKLINMDSESYSDGGFVTTDYSIVADGMGYTYDVGNASAEPMDVFITCEKNFYTVNFYTSDSLTTLMKSQYVNKGESATAPADYTAPQCKVPESWSEDFSDVQSDLNIYAVWKTAHENEIISAVDGDNITIKCTACGEERTVKYSEHITRNAAKDNFIEILDVNNDGVINSRDYAVMYASCNG